jgi:small subunit ribosomal protein S1
MGNVPNEKAENTFSVGKNGDFTAVNRREIFLEKKREASNGDEESNQDRHDFMAMYEENLNSIREGKVIKGEIVQIDKEFVLVDIGYKSEGQIRIGEFTNLKGRLTAKVGDEVDVVLVRKENKDGRIILSKEKAAKVKLLDRIEECFRNQDSIRGRIISMVKGGLSVDIGVPAFLPGSQADLRPVRDLSTLIGTEHDFKILKYEKREENIVLSRRATLEAEQTALREKTFALLEKDALIKGIITNIKDYGLFVELGGVVGLLHISDMSWGRAGHPSDLYRVGDEITVKVLKVNREKERVSLGLKQMTPDPWSKAEEKYPIHTRVKGKVLSLVEFGAFVEVEKGIEGLIQVSEIPWTEEIRHPSQVLSVGDIVDAIVLSIDVAKKRISLSMKRLEKNPLEDATANAQGKREQSPEGISDEG